MNLLEKVFGGRVFPQEVLDVLDPEVKKDARQITADILEDRRRDHQDMAAVPRVEKVVKTMYKLGRHPEVVRDAEPRGGRVTMVWSRATTVSAGSEPQRGKA